MPTNGRGFCVATEILRSVLGDLLYDARHIVVVADANDCLLWSDGHPDVLRASERIRLSPGHAWSEEAAGTQRGRHGAGRRSRRPGVLGRR